MLYTGVAGDIRFRSNSDGTYYNLRFSTDGTYDLTVPSGTLFSGTVPISVFTRGNGAANAIQITAWQNTFIVLVNGQYLNAITDTSNNASVGELGFFAIDANNTTSRVNFAHLWILQ